MARPSIAALFDHTVRVWRPVVNRSRLGVDERGYVVVAASLGAKLNRSSAPVADGGPGLQPTGSRRFYMAPDADVVERDIIEVLTGPDSGQTWEVDEPPTRPNDHHTQFDARYWAGGPSQLVEPPAGEAHFTAGAVLAISGNVSEPGAVRHLEMSFDSASTLLMVGESINPATGLPLISTEPLRTSGAVITTEPNYGLSEPLRTAGAVVGSDPTLGLSEPLLVGASVRAP